MVYRYARNLLGAEVQAPNVASPNRNAYRWSHSHWRRHSEKVLPGFSGIGGFFHDSETCPNQMRFFKRLWIFHWYLFDDRLYLVLIKRTLPETKKQFTSWKMDGWNFDRFLLGPVTYFQGKGLLHFREDPFGIGDVFQLCASVSFTKKW